MVRHTGHDNLKFAVRSALIQERQWMFVSSFQNHKLHSLGLEHCIHCNLIGRFLDIYCYLVASSLIVAICLAGSHSSE